jgi:ribosome maturation factor RimP
VSEKAKPSPKGPEGRSKAKGARAAKPSEARAKGGEAASRGLKEAMGALEPSLPVLAAKLGLELAGSKLATSRGKPALRIVIDKPFEEGGPPRSQVTIGDCAAMSRAVSRLLDKIYPGEGPEYSLEVSSPGLDRTLSTEADFRRFHGALAKLGLILEGKTARRVGRLSTKEGPFKLVTESGEIAFDLSIVKSARLVPEI